ncbi:hypothetical protein CfE428DRAFT_6402 [Chthoniobacter flavus Ellin428]|uniref:DUF6968 domain-containing protein n=1 Tax=Chthoniobacter flavus Ellin428 TaxID=497964 RepID=B4DBW1_9BACT|nr:hypothetical protein [Chthoniobacter flavus]EDY16077.1 hypothetical protein CfE428DRAFT_6402 [Chthoniobacter flavus Ellin428]TCO83858.1 hypothetical protein EV701_14014 [Chthoniobacter flavus]
MIEPFANREFSCLSLTGERFAFTVRIGRPTPVSNEPDSDWRCPVTVPFDAPVRDIYGVDSWQAVCLALSLVHSQLVDFIQRGGKLYYPGTTDEFTLNDFFPNSTGNA